MIILFVSLIVEAKDQISSLTDEISQKADDNIRQQVYIIFLNRMQNKGLIFGCVCSLSLENIPKRNPFFLFSLLNFSSVLFPFFDHAKCVVKILFSSN